MPVSGGARDCVCEAVTDSWVAAGSVQASQECNVKKKKNEKEGGEDEEGKITYFRWHTDLSFSETWWQFAFQPTALH